MKIILFFVGFLPSSFQRLLRNALGAKIERGAKISIFSFVLTRNLQMKRGARIGPFCLIKVPTLKMGENAAIHAMVLVNCLSFPRACLEIGDFSQIFSFSVLEPSEGIFIGKHVGVGGQALIFCHGSWPNYLEGGPFTRGSVHIEDEVWLAWRVMILPGSKIESKAIVGAHSLVRGNVPSQSLFSGVPAKFISDQIWQKPTSTLRRQRFKEIISAFHDFHHNQFKNQIGFFEITDSHSYSGVHNLIYSLDPLSPADFERFRKCRDTTVVDLINLKYFSQSSIGTKFIQFMGDYGLRFGPPS